MEATLDWQGATPTEAADAFRAFQDELPSHLETAVEELALRIQATAQRLVNVDTGRLRASIDHELERVAEEIVRGSIGSNVAYAPFHEFDYPFLRPAFEEHRADIETRVGQAVEDAWEAVR